MADVDAVPEEWRDRHAADLIGIGAAAQRLGMSVPQLRTAAAAGRVPSLLTDGGTRRFRPIDLALLLAVAREAAHATDGDAARPSEAA
ncbi:hypothetical protein [Geodermatophilus sp. URMC 60]